MKTKQDKINLEDNRDLMDKYNNENMLDNNLENKKKKKLTKKKLMKIKIQKK